MAERAVDSLINSSFLNPANEGGLGYLFKNITDRPLLDSPEALLEQRNRQLQIIIR